MGMALYNAFQKRYCMVLAEVRAPLSLTQSDGDLVTIKNTNTSYFSQIGVPIGWPCLRIKHI